MRPRFHPRLCAHRGWQLHHQENSREALEAAARSGIAACEFDVRRSADGVWVVNHDPDLERLHGHAGRLDRLTFSEIQRLAPLVSLEDALALFGADCQPLVECKETSREGADELADLLRRARARTPVAVIARGREMPGALLERLKQVPVYYYTRSWAEAHRLRHASLHGFDLPYRGVPLDRIREWLTPLRTAGKRVVVFTVNDRAVCRSWLEAGADLVISDRPWELG